MNFSDSPIQIYHIFILLNLIIAVVLLIYSLYLGKEEKKLAKKDSQLDSLASEIIQKAHLKALNILKNSDYISTSLRNEINTNFDSLLGQLRDESKDFYREIEEEYIKSSTKFAQDIEKKAEHEMSDFSKKVNYNTEELRKNFEKIYGAELQKSVEDINAYKASQKEEFKKEMTQKIQILIKLMLPRQITIEDHEKLVNEAVEKAYKDNFFAPKN